MSDEPAGLPPPRANPELIGQAAAEAVLSRAMGEGRLPHAWLLTGPKGIGKATLAYRFARAVLAGGGGAPVAEPEPGLFGAEALPAAAPAGGLVLDQGHPVFRRVASGGHLDLMTLAPPAKGTGAKRGEIAVGEVRKAVDFLHLTPAGGGWRVVVVDPVEGLNRSAANALLKALEEPPRRALLLLVSHAPGGLLATIRSRCCRLALAPLEEAVVRDLLARGRPDLDPETAAALARLADGSIGRALALAAGGGLELYEELLGLIGGLAPAAGQGGRLDAVRLHRFADRLARGGDGRAFTTARDLFIWWLARLVRAGASGRAAGEVVAGEAALMAALLARRSLAQWIALWDKVSRLLTPVERANLDRKQALLAAFLELEAALGPD